jgi:hypothetical protein
MRFLAFFLALIFGAESFAVDTVFPLDCEANARARVANALVNNKVRDSTYTTNVNSQISKWGLVSLDPAGFGFLADAEETNYASVSASSATLTAPVGTFSADDAGKIIHVQGAGIAAGTLTTTIASVTNDHSIVLTAAATTTVTASKTSKAGIAVWGWRSDSLVELNPRLSTDGKFSYQRNYATDYASPQNVKITYGAKGDGVTDDTAALQTAASSSQFLYFPEGRYLVSSVVNFVGAVHLIGDGDKSVIVSDHRSFSITSATGAYVSRLRFENITVPWTINRWDANEDFVVGSPSAIQSYYGYQPTVNDQDLWAGLPSYVKTQSINGELYIEGGRDVLVDNCSFRHASVTLKTCQHSTVSNSRFWGGNSYGSVTFWNADAGGYGFENHADNNDIIYQSNNGVCFIGQKRGYAMRNNIRLTGETAIKLYQGNFDAGGASSGGDPNPGAGIYDARCYWMTVGYNTIHGCGMRVLTLIWITRIRGFAPDIIWRSAMLFRRIILVGLVGTGHVIGIFIM